jgi:hypothetical protein
MIGCLALITACDGEPSVWMIPPAAQKGICFRELFTQPEQWKETRKRINVIGYADHHLHRQFKDDELRAWLPMLDKWDLKLGLEVGAVKPWGTTGKATFNAQRPMWDRFQSMGGRIYAVAMDEPLCCVRKDLKKTDTYAIEETATFVALTRKRYPDILIGDIEPYPFIPLADMISWIDTLQAKLKQMNVRGLDFFRLDVDWVNFTMGKHGNWQEVKKIEEACRKREIPFSLIYWAADYPHLQHMGLAHDDNWYISIFRQGYDYALVGGSPDEYVIESWVGAPSRTLPETADWTFTRSVRDFCRRFVKVKK